VQTPNVVQHATLQPGTCLSCGTITGPYIDTLCDVPVHGRVYICVRNCLAVWNDLLGYADPVSVEAMHSNAQSLVDRLTEAVAENEALKLRLEQAETPNLVSLETVRELLKPRGPKAAA
jgi:hypothetical protein